MAVRIIKRKSGIYDIYRRDNGTWLQSYNSPDNVLEWLSEQVCPNPEFIDESIGDVSEFKADSVSTEPANLNAASRVEAIKFFNRHLEADVLQYGERQAIHCALAALQEQRDCSELARALSAKMQELKDTIRKLELKVYSYRVPSKEEYLRRYKRGGSE